MDEITLKKIKEYGWITPEDITNAYTELIRSIENIIKTDFRSDLIVDRLDNFKMELVCRCNRNIEKENEREKLFSYRRDLSKRARDVPRRTKDEVSDESEPEPIRGRLGSGYNDES